MRAVDVADQVEPSEYEKLPCTVLRAKLACEKYDAKPIFGNPLSKLNRLELLQALSEQHKVEDPGTPPTSDPNNQKEELRLRKSSNNLSYFRVLERTMVIKNGERRFKFSFVDFLLWQFVLSLFLSTIK